MTEGFETNAQRLSVLFSAGDRARHHSLAIEILARAREGGLAGATLMQAERGIGRTGVVHEEHLFREDAPLCVMIVDSKDRISRFVAQLASLGDRVRLVVTNVNAERA